MFQRFTQARQESAWREQDKTPELAGAVALMWEEGIYSTNEITRALRAEGWRVTEAGVANQLATFRDERRRLNQAA